MQTNQYGLESLVERLGKMIPILAKHLPISEYPLFQEFLDVHNSLAFKMGKGKQRYQDNAEFYRQNTRNWRKENPDKAKAYQDQWRGKPCQCEEKDRRNWYIFGRVKKKKPSSPQNYEVICDICGASWKTRAKFCAELSEYYGV